MPDIKRSLFELQALYADNVTGDISPQDLRDGFKTVVGNYFTSASSDSVINLSANEVYLSINTSASNVTVKLPNPLSDDGSGDIFKGKYYVLTNYSPTSANNNIILSAATTINNQTNTFNISANNTNTVITDGVTWYTHNIPTSGTTTSSTGSQWVTSGSGITYDGGKVKINTLSASTLVSTNSANELESLGLSLYPSLTEISYGKGMRGNAQQAIDARFLPPTAPWVNANSTTLTLTVGTPIYSYFPCSCPVIISAYFFRRAILTSSGDVEVGLFKKISSTQYDRVSGSNGTVTVGSDVEYTVTLASPITVLIGSSDRYFIGLILKSGDISVDRSTSFRTLGYAFSGATGQSALPSSETTVNGVGNCPIIQVF